MNRTAAKRRTKEASTADPRASKTPVLPSGPKRADRDTINRLRRFHFGVKGDEASLFSPGDYVPLAPPPSLHDPASDYPVFLLPVADVEDDRLHLSIDGFVQAAAQRADQTMGSWAPELAHWIREATSKSSLADPGAVWKTVKKAAEKAGATPETRSVIDALERVTPAGGQFLSHTPAAPYHLLFHAARARFAPTWEAFADERRGLTDLLRGIIDTERAKRDTSGNDATLRNSLGTVGSQFLDPKAMSDIMGAPRGTQSMDPERESSLSASLQRLEDSLSDTAFPKIRVLAQPSLLEALPGPFDDCRFAPAEDPCATAASVFDDEAASVAAWLRDVRLAKLESEGRYDPQRHDPWLSAFEWSSFSRDELALIPPVIAVITAEYATGPGMPSLSRLLRSGRPVQILILAQPAESPGSKTQTHDPGYRVEPAYLGVSHREALVQQTVAAHPGHMMRGFVLGMNAAHTALHVLVDPSADGQNPGAGTPAVLSRAHPLFHYDPELGATWARRLQFGGNPDATEDWASHTVKVQRKPGGETTLTLAFTFADYVLLTGERSEAFLPIPEDLADDELIPLSEHTLLPPEEAPRRLPFIWGVDKKGTLHRLCVSRNLVLESLDRLDYWRTLQELAGIRNEYVETAAARVRRELELAAAEEHKQLLKSHDQALRTVREQATEDVVNRLTALLLDMDVAALAQIAPPSVGLAGFQNMSVDQATATLLSLIDPATMDGKDNAAPADENVLNAAAKLKEIATTEPVGSDTDQT